MTTEHMLLFRDLLEHHHVLLDLIALCYEILVLVGNLRRRGHGARILGRCNDCGALFLLTSSCTLSFPLSDSTAAAFVTPGAERVSVALSAERRDFLSAAAAAAGMALPLAANAIRDYENVGLLGGSEIIDINNANVRAYIKLPGMYPNAAGKIASNGPYKSVSEIFNIPGLTSSEKDAMKKYESRFVTKSPAADYVIDRINNGLYR